MEGNPEFDAIAARNPLDMVLYNYILQLFEDQKLIIDSYFLEAEEEEEETLEEVANELALLPPGADVGTSLLSAVILLSPLVILEAHLQESPQP